MARTTTDLVKSVLPVSPTKSLKPFIDTASKLVDKMTECAGDDLDEQHLELIERWLAAHYFSVVNPNTLTSKSIGGASKSFQSSPVTTGLSGTVYGQQALSLDTSGCLEKLTGETVSLVWLGDNEDDYCVDWSL